MRSVLTRGVRNAAMTGLLAAMVLTGTSAEAQRKKLVRLRRNIDDALPVSGDAASATGAAR